MKKLSVITICYNEPNLEQTCESIVNQTFQDFEWIVIDGGSNEETQKIWDKYKYRIDKFVSEKDNGIYDACNKGIELASGEYLNFMNAGDSFADIDVLEKVFNQKRKFKDVLYGNEYWIQNDNSKKLHVMPSKIKLDLLINSTIRHQSSFIKRELFIKYGLYSEKYRIVSDWEKWIVFFKNRVSFEYLPFVIANYDASGCSFSENFNVIHNQEREEVLHKYFEEKIINKIKNNISYTTCEQIFSIKNSINKNHKIITILGIHIKLKRRKK